jgi:hypothetical protein
MNRVLSPFTLCAALVLLVALPGVALAQKPVTHEKDAVVVKSTITAIDHDARTVTIEDKNGDTRTIDCGPEIRRFDELKVGDVATFRTTEATVYQIRKAGESAQPSVKDAPVIVRTPGAKPGAEDRAGDDDGSDQGHGPQDLLGHRPDGGRQDHQLQGQGQEPPERPRGRRSCRDHLHQGGRDQHRVGAGSSDPPGAERKKAAGA